MVNSLGLIETIGMAAAVEAADTAIKAANINIIGYELTKGLGMVTVKIEGDVSAVKTALDAAKYSASQVNKVCSVLLIPRPAENIERLIISDDTIGVKRNEENIDEVIQYVEEIYEKEFNEENSENQEIDEKVDEIDEKVNSSFEDESEICNLCGDPKCPRRKGQPRILCIHHKKYFEGENHGED